MYRPARSLARLVRAASRRSGRSCGTTAPGRMLLRIAPGSMRSMARELEAGSIDDASELVIHLGRILLFIEERHDDRNETHLLRFLYGPYADGFRMRHLKNDF